MFFNKEHRSRTRLFRIIGTLKFFTHESNYRSERMGTMKEVAMSAETSTATVSRVINQTGYVSDEVKKRVLQAIEKLDYKPLQREGINKKTRTIALIIPDIENPFFGKMTKEVSKIANELKYNILLINVKGLKNDGGDFLLNLIATRVDGIIYASSYRLGDVAKKARDNKIPIVALDRELSTTESDSVAVNNNQAGFISTEYLIQLGHKKIAFIGGTENMEISINRHKGYKRALNQYEIDYDEILVQCGDFTMESGYKATKKLIDKSDEITAILAANDLMAIGAINYLNFKGYKIPKDISVIGFDDIDLASSITPKLTTVSYPLERMSQLAIESILKHLSEPDAACESVSLFTKLVIRESAGKATD